MPVPSLATSRDHPVVGCQLIRTWTPKETPKAEIVLVHGIAEHSGRYERTGGLLAEAGFSVTAADLVGCGATGGRRADIHDWAHLLDQVEALVSDVRKSGREVVLLGHSMGGLIALEYALSERPRPDLLVLSAPALKGGARWQRRIAPFLAKIAPTLPIPNKVKGEQLSRDPAIGEAYFADPLVHPSSTPRFGSKLFAAMDRTRSAMSRLDIPALVLHGGMDSIVRPTVTVELGSQPVVERRVYPALRHELFNEPEGPKVIAEVAEWITSRLA